VHFRYGCGNRRPRRILGFLQPRQWAILEGTFMHSIIYLVGLVVVVLAILSLLGLR